MATTEIKFRRKKHFLGKTRFLPGTRTSRIRICQRQKIQPNSNSKKLAQHLCLHVCKLRYRVIKFVPKQAKSLLKPFSVSNFTTICFNKYRKMSMMKNILKKQYFFKECTKNPSMRTRIITLTNLKVVGLLWRHNYKKSSQNCSHFTKNASLILENRDTVKKLRIKA